MNEKHGDAAGSRRGGARRSLCLRPGRPDEANVLSDLAYRSKGYWGYDEAFLEACRDELRLSPHDVRNYRVAVAEDEQRRVVGFYALTGISDDDAELTFFFVDPDEMGTGVGRSLFAHMEDVARRAGSPTSASTPTRTPARSTNVWAPP